VFKSRNIAPTFFHEVEKVIERDENNCDVVGGSSDGRSFKNSIYRHTTQ